MGRCSETWTRGVKPSGFQRTLKTTRCLCFRYTRLIRKETLPFQICDFYFQFLGFALTKKNSFLLLLARIKDCLKLQWILTWKKQDHTDEKRESLETPDEIYTVAYFSLQFSWNRYIFKIPTFGGFWFFFSFICIQSLISQKAGRQSHKQQVPKWRCGVCFFLLGICASVI